MKKIKLFIPLFVGISTISAYSVFANSNDIQPTSVSYEACEVDYFPGLNDDDKVIQLDDGGFLNGQAWLQDGNNTIYLNSETDPNAITIKEAKEIIKSETE